MQEGQQVGGVLAGGVHADAKVDARVLAGHLGQTLFQGLVSAPGFEELQRLGSRLEVFAEEGDMVAVARRVEADADDRVRSTWARRRNRFAVSRTATCVMRNLKTCDSGFNAGRSWQDCHSTLCG